MNLGKSKNGNFFFYAHQCSLMGGCFLDWVFLFCGVSCLLWVLFGFLLLGCCF